MWRKEKKQAAGDLRVRVYPEDAFPAEALPFLVTRPFAPGLIEAVVADYPDTIRPINRSEIGATHPVDLFTSAVHSAVHDEQTYVKLQEYARVPYHVIGGTHRYVGSHVHVLDRYIDVGAAPYGALVALPLPEYVFVHTIRETHVVSALTIMSQVAEEFFNEGDRAITPQLYWWRHSPAQVPGSQAPDLRPVGARLNRSDGFIELFGPDTRELVELWTADHPSA
ncbi:hypothetical protein ACIA49_29330 [Kribbella sp. NPDC051587]|uniref:hypothetical protein n=1 Tax=Kribbella sp. NPDC051587 TaxID=3364119 RepID=UPI0037ABF8B5